MIDVAYGVIPGSASNTCSTVICVGLTWTGGPGGYIRKGCDANGRFHAHVSRLTGTWIVYPWYREALAVQGDDDYAGCAGAVLPTGTCSPRDFLKSNVSGDTESWHNFGMELKEHIAWAAPFLATAVAFIVAYYGARLIKRPWLRAATIVMFVGAFAAAAIGGFFGAFLNKIAPIV